jgi:tetratricopeptide (TPR) repeat protein
MRWPASARTLLLALAAGLASTSAHAAPDDDDWSLERNASDPALVGQRFTKLRNHPFDRQQFRALERAIGREALAKKIDAALARDPGDVALGVLAARIAIARGKPADAAARLATIEAKAGRRAGAVFDLRVDALEAAGDTAGAIAALRERASGASGKQQAALLSRALELAEQGGQLDVAIELAKARVAVRPSDREAQLRLARIAARANEGDIAEAAFAEALALSRGAERDELALEVARAKLDRGDGSAAADATWSLLDDPRRGNAFARAPRWDLLVEAHRTAGTAETLVATLEAWLAKHGGEAAAWRALAAAQDLAGQDASAARRRAIELDPRDEGSQDALIEQMATRGDTRGAIEEYRRYAARHAGDFERGLALAGSLLQGPDRALGLELAAEIAARTKKKSAALPAFVEFYNLGDEPELALSAARRWVGVAGRSPEAHTALGEQLFQMGRLPDALASWGKLPKLVRPAHKGWARHAEVLAEHGLVTDAVTSLKAAMKLAPDEPAYLRLRAVFAEEQRRPAVALEMWEELRRRATAPEHALLRDEARTRVVELLVEGSVPSRLERVAAAERSARAALDAAEPIDDAVEAGRFLVELHTRREHYTAAVAVAQQLARMQPSSADRLAELAAAQRRAGEPAAAIATLEAMLALDPGRKGDVLGEISELAFEAGDDTRALASAHAAAKAGGQADALVRLGELHERKGDLDAAAAAYAEAMGSKTLDARAALHLAELEVTRANLDRARELLSAVLEKGNGGGDQVRDAGRRLLDLSQGEGDAIAVLGLAVQRTTRQPQADEPRDFLLSALDRIPDREVTAWLDAGEAKERRTQLRAALLAATERGTVGGRARAAEHLRDLGLPDTAMPLLRASETISAPRDATPTVRDAFDRARVTIVRAAAAQRDADAVASFERIIEDPSSSRPLAQAAAWGLALAEPPPKVWYGLLARDADPIVAVLGCIALARTEGEVPNDLRLDVGGLARDSRLAEVRHACALAEARLAEDDELEGIVARRGAADPVLAAIAMWRRGRATSRADEIDAELFSTLLGTPGLERDAAAAALRRRIVDERTVDRRGADREATRDARREAALEPPPAPTLRAYGPALERWLAKAVAPRFEPVAAAALAPKLGALSRAVAANAAGTRAERAALADAMRPCSEAVAPSRDGVRSPDTTTSKRASVRDDAASSTRICVAPLSDETVMLGGRTRD